MPMMIVVAESPCPDTSDTMPLVAETRVAVQGEHLLDALHRTVGDHVERAAGLHLLRRLEDQPDAAGQRGRRGQREAGAEQHRGVRVVAAGVHHAGDGGRVREAGVLLQRQGVEVGAQRDAAIAVADVADEAGAAGERAGFETGRHQLAGHERRGAVLGAAELGVRVQGATPGDDVVTVRGQPRVEPGRSTTGAEVGHRGTPGRDEIGVRVEQGHRFPPITAGTAELSCIGQWCSPGRRCTNLKGSLSGVSSPRGP